MKEPRAINPLLPSAKDDSADTGMSRDGSVVRWSNWIVILALLWFGVRVAQVRSREGDLPFQSANDRSRWCTVRALVDHGTYEIDSVIADRRWDTIDKVAHPRRDGSKAYYSSKPPLLATLVAGWVYLEQAISGYRLAEHPMLIGRMTVAFVNGGLLLGYLTAMRAIFLRFARNAWSAVFLTTVAAWGTHLTSFAITLNNHLPAATGVAGALWCLARLWDPQTSNHRGRLSLGLGVASAWAAANELPALAFLVIMTLCVFWKEGTRERIAFGLGAAVVLLAALGTSWCAHATFIPAYAHRAPGGDWQSGNWYAYPGSYWLPGNRRGVDVGEPSIAVYAWHTTVGHHGVLSLTPLWLLGLYGLPGLVSKFRRVTHYLTAVTTLGVLLTLVCWCFYVFLRPLGDRNYGGVSVCFRWMLWLIPIWLTMLSPVIDRLSESRWGRAVAVVVAAMSIASAAYGWWRPWQHPWLFVWWPGG